MKHDINTLTLPFELTLTLTLALELTFTPAITLTIILVGDCNVLLFCEVHSFEKLPTYLCRYNKGRNRRHGLHDVVRHAI